MLVGARTLPPMHDADKALTEASMHGQQALPRCTRGCSRHSHTLMTAPARARRMLLRSWPTPRPHPTNHLNAARCFATALPTRPRRHPRASTAARPCQACTAACCIAPPQGSRPRPTYTHSAHASVRHSGHALLKLPGHEALLKSAAPPDLHRTTCLGSSPDG